MPEGDADVNVDGTAASTMKNADKMEYLPQDGEQERRQRPTLSIDRKQTTSERADAPADKPLGIAAQSSSAAVS